VQYTNKALFVFAGVKKDVYGEILGARIAWGRCNFIGRSLYCP
jgi:hypothetical protein